MAGATVPMLAWLAFGPAGVQAQGGDWSGPMHPMMWTWGAWGILMMLMMVAFWGLIIAGIVLGVRWLTRHAGGQPTDRALEILRERYARGDITREAFDARRRDLLSR